MQFCFIANGDVLTLPITPASYEWTTGKNMETINISELGDVYLPGGRSRHSGSIDCLLPFRDYPFIIAGAILDPGYYLEPLRYWAAEKIPRAIHCDRKRYQCACVYRERDGKGAGRHG